MMADRATGALYEIVVRGELDERFGLLFKGMEVRRTGGTTILAGEVRDQAKLHGLIEQVEELGLELISVQQVTREPAGQVTPGRAGSPKATKGQNDV
jgi:hypothetical protein